MRGKKDPTPPSRSQWVLPYSFHWHYMFCNGHQFSYVRMTVQVHFLRHVLEMFPVLAYPYTIQFYFLHVLFKVTVLWTIVHVLCIQRSGTIFLPDHPFWCRLVSSDTPVFLDYCQLVSFWSVCPIEDWADSCAEPYTFCDQLSSGGFL